MGLIAFQNDFREWLQHNDPHAGERMSVVSPHGLVVYDDNYHIQLQKCLANMLPRTAAYMGDEPFRAASNAYIYQHPPFDWTLDSYPSRFPGFMREFTPARPEIAELAEFELRLVACSLTRDTAPLTLAALEPFALPPQADAAGKRPIASLATEAWHRLALRVVPSANIMAMHTNAQAIWSAVTAEAPVPEAATREEPAPYLFWRQGFSNHFRSLKPIEWQILPHLTPSFAYADLHRHTTRLVGEEYGTNICDYLMLSWTREGLLAPVEQPTEG